MAAEDTPTPTQHVWTRLYPAGVGEASAIHDESTAHAWNDRVEAYPDQTAVTYRGRTFTTTDIDREAEALATGFLARGLQKSSIVGVYLQNVPQFAVALLAAWKIGVVPLVLNPMYRGRELRALVDDSAASAIICDEADLDQVRETLTGSSLTWVLTTDDDEYDRDPADFTGNIQTADLSGNTQAAAAAHPGNTLTQAAAHDAGITVDSWGGFLAAHRTEAFAGRADAPNHRTDLLPGLDDAALLTYTSGTTGPAKGAVGTHRNVLAVARSYGAWMNLGEGDVMLAIAPLFHITGAVACAATSLIFPITLDFIGRVNANKIVTAIRDDKVTVTIGSITVYNALLEHETATSDDLMSIRCLYSGGAPVPPATVERFRNRFGHYIHNIYGMTETASAVIGVPPNTEAPVDPATDTLAVGVPFPGLEARIVDVADGTVVTDATAGELELRGPQITPGYLGRPEADEAAFDDGWLRTGDVGVMDDAGWIYLVDRIKDQINASGYKVWPREVEDVLYEHPAVLEAAVVGQPDDYRGETVVAYVSLRAGQSASADELIAFAKERLAAYKYPRIVHVMSDLPKTHTGKIQRRLLRDSGRETTAEN
ncbi:class I adenylate-forming enzyme family protein [Brevibacterium sp. CFH 10365]|uniref:class I adenylate-forming enzyme family protein n=1 Tax=Brevibacterium sp. CFH 10365 TaxID=2585207 RepID=UPI0012665D1D|nr:AMP-binding protein [Brevibacterium sp. CFH 10365]